MIGSEQTRHCSIVHTETYGNHKRQADESWSKSQTLPAWKAYLSQLGKVTFRGRCLSINTAGCSGSLMTFIRDDIIDRGNDISSFPPDCPFSVSSLLDQTPPREWNSWLRKALPAASGPPPGGASSVACSRSSVSSVLSRQPW